MSWLSRNDGITRSSPKNARWRRRKASNSLALLSPKAKNASELLEQDEIEAAVQPALVA